MATVSLGTADQTEHVPGRLEVALCALRIWLDAFASNRMRRTAAEAEQARPRRFPSTQSRSTKQQ